jgi:FkbM family methyltransferase
LVNFRRTGNTRHLSNYSVRLAEQYFDKIVAFHAGEVFIDCGGFDGDTTYQFIKKCDDYKRVWLFEPSEANMQKAKRRLVGIRDINYVSKGLSDAPGTVSFNSEAGSASAVSESGGNTIVVTTIDNEINDPVTFIKMDLEGWELKALNGSRSHIERNHPKLAIAVYHSASDFWKIPEFVLGICKDYQIYLRHYTEGWSESVMYFIPE